MEIGFQIGEIENMIEIGANIRITLIFHLKPIYIYIIAFVIVYNKRDYKCLNNEKQILSLNYH